MRINRRTLAATGAAALATGAAVVGSTHADAAAALNTDAFPDAKGPLGRLKP